MNRLEEWEANSIIESIPYMNRMQRETDRYKLYVAIQTNSKKKLKPEDILKLPWDNEDNDTEEFVPLTDEQHKAMQDKMKALESIFQNEGEVEKHDIIQNGTELCNTPYSGCNPA